MTNIRRTFSSGFFVIIGMTGLLLLAAIIVLPALGPPYPNPAQAQASDDSSTLKQQKRHIGKDQRNSALPGELYETSATTN